MYSIAMNDVAALGVLADVVDRDDVRVREDARRLRLAHEALAELARLGIVVVPLRGPDRLDGHEPADDRILGEVDDAHRPLAELVQDLVAAQLRPRALPPATFPT